MLSIQVRLSKFDGYFFHSVLVRVLESTDMVLKVGIFLALLFVPFCSGANILGLFTSSTKSHLIIHMAYVDALIAQGHNLTIVTTLPIESKSSKFNHVLIPQSPEFIENIQKLIKAATNDPSPISTMKHELKSYMLWTSNQYHAMRHEKLQTVLRDNEFDLLVLGYFFNDFQIAVAAQLKIPVVINWMLPPFGMINSYAGNPTGLGYVPNVLVNANQPMTFMHRLASVVMDGFTYAVEKFLNYKFDQYYE